MFLTQENRSQSNSCLSIDFTCANGDCIRKAWMCDGSSDCDDGSDENNCKDRNPKLDLDANLCPTGNVQCPAKNGSNICLPLSRLCDNRPDCKDGEDEGSLCNNACNNNGMCSHLCSPTPFGPVCSCPKGFVICYE